ncbi:hypothetical protein BH23PAT2_BH23PAT2_03620 [soil metagenome]
MHEYLGFGGTFAAGKDTLAVHLCKTYGYMMLSSGDLVRDIAMKDYGNIERETLRKTANEYRSKNGSDYFIRLAFERYQVRKKQNPSIKGIIISGLRSVGEVRAMKDNGALIVFVDADSRVRYERMRERKRDDEVLKTFDEFTAGEKTEMKNDDENAQNIGAVKAMADVVLDNSGEVDAFLSSAVHKLQQ